MDYYKDSEKVDQYIKMAEGHNAHSLIEKLKTYSDKDSKVLEIGSGPGSDYAILLNTYKEIVGSDFSSEFLIRLLEKYPEGIFFELDAKDLDIDLKFDIIFSNKVLHHLEDEDFLASLTRQADLLNDSGIICHTFWKGEGTEDYDGMFVNLHTIEELKTLLSAKFEILEVELYKEFEEDDSIYLIAKKL